MKRASYFATKLTCSRDIQKCSCFWEPSYDLDPPPPQSKMPGSAPAKYNHSLLQVFPHKLDLTLLDITNMNIDVLILVHSYRSCLAHHELMS